MQGPVVLAGKPLGAQRALEWLLPRVGAQVFDHGGAECKRHGAHAALEGLLSRVRAQVVHQVALPAELALAEMALVHGPTIAGHPVPADRRLAPRPVIWKLIRPPWFRL